MRIAVIILFSCLFIFTSYGQANLNLDQAKEYRQEGYRLQSMGDLEGALQYYQKAVQLDPAYIDVYNDLGVIYESMGQDAQALRMYKDALEINPQHLPTFTNLAFFYERKGDIEQATHYWQKRYALGEKGEYWWEVSRQHLLRLGTYPRIQEEIQEKEAARLSQELVYQREQQRLKAIEEAHLHFHIGVGFFKRGEYPAAIKEFETASAVNPSDTDLRAKIDDLFVKAHRAYAKEQALAYTAEALDYIKQDDFLSAGEKLKYALSSVFRISQKK